MLLALKEDRKGGRGDQYSIRRSQGTKGIDGSGFTKLFLAKDSFVHTAG